jgi:hypothetical protein
MNAIHRLFVFGAAGLVAALAGCNSSDDVIAPAPAPAAAVAPTIMTQPVSAMVNAGESASFVIAADGTAPLSYQWQRDGADIVGANAATYATPPTVAADNGATFRVVVANSAGTAISNSAALSVMPAATAPAITQQPANASVAVGQTATFSVVATGTLPLAYQWQRDGAAIPGATVASYTTPAAQIADNGALFRVVVSNAFGSATSANATLGVSTAAPGPVTVTLAVPTAGNQPKQIALAWTLAGPGAAAITSIRVWLRPNDAAPYQQLPEILTGTSGTVALPSTTVLNWPQARIRVQACTAALVCTDSNEQVLTNALLLATIGYFKASNTFGGDMFGTPVALSADGNTLAVTALGEDSSATGIDGNQADNAASLSGAVYVFARIAGVWSQQAYVKASNTAAGDAFGENLALSADGNTLAVAAPGEDSSATGIGGNQADNSMSSAGAVYIFSRSGTTWTQQAYIKASNTGDGDSFGESVAISGDGNTLAVGAQGEDSSATDVGGDQANNTTNNAGAVYVFTRSGTSWTQQSYVKASNTGLNDAFGRRVAMSGDGNTLVVASPFEDSAATGIGGNQADNTAFDTGAVYVFARSGSSWVQQAYVKASNGGAAGQGDEFGGALSISSDGNTLAVGAKFEDSNAIGINGDGVNEAFNGAGAAYVFARSGMAWTQQAYIKASNTGVSDWFAEALGLSADGNTLVVGAPQEDSAAKGVGGDQTDNSLAANGAAYVFKRSGTTWTQTTYVKPRNAGILLNTFNFGEAVAVSGDGSAIVVGASGEDGNATGVNGTPSGASVTSGAAYLY